MPKTLDRPHITESPTQPAPDVAPPLRDVPPLAHEPGRQHNRYIGWMGWVMLLVVVLVVTMLLVMAVSGDDPVTDVDGSFAANEAARLETYRPALAVPSNLLYIADANGLIGPM